MVGSGRKWSEVVGSGREWSGVVGSGREWAACKHLWLTAKALECLRATPDHSRPLPTTSIFYRSIPDHSRPFPTTPDTPDHSRPLPTTPDHFRPLPTTSDHFRPHTSDPVLTTPDHEATILLKVWNAYKSHSRPLPKLLTTRARSWADRKGFGTYGPL